MQICGQMKVQHFIGCLDGDAEQEEKANATICTEGQTGTDMFATGRNRYIRRGFRGLT